ALCVSASDDPKVSKAFCFPACAPGVAQLDKCGERTEVACEPLELEPSAGFCRPLCTRDEECRHGGCDQRRGVCTTLAPSGAAFGQPCSPNAEPSECAGLCLDLGDG